MGGSDDTNVNFWRSESHFMCCPSGRQIRLSLSAWLGRSPSSPSIPKGTQGTMTPRFNQAVRRTAAAIAVASVAASTLSLTANADPKQLSAFVGVGSDTTQDVVNALAGHANGNNYNPIQSSAASGKRQIISFDATPPPGTSGACIIAKAGGPSFARPNGSSAGRRALSRAIDSTGFAPGVCSPGAVNIAGQVNFARSSAGPASGDVGTALTYIPFGRDGVSFATYRTDGGAVTALTPAQLTSLFSTGRQTINGVSVLPCGIQTGSGTFAFWNTALGVTAAQELAATAECNALLGARAQENDGIDLKARGDAADAAVNGTQVVIGFSAAAFIAKTKQVAEPAPPAGVSIGEITGVGNPVVGAGATIAPNAAFYNNTTFGRNVYNVVSTPIIDSAFGNADIKTLFKGATSSLCLAVSTIETFGFTVAPNCGATTLKGSLFTGQGA
jgi:hypothetical protein